ncbi:ABC transporter substrate-binding protein [Roseomonas haemaphysalidis]|uniref:ABC transporter substrate-binding protein n=1 Tax=Roseomonas haemaphysalidis TaxID=2768162 RepID=A0ABS3KRL4_9PROT|nr:ABC transporter substrate-binding protein [Roseomonas haemaphysalidis]MBO1079595.1 ABC transporter substrate-binding protein [Roseomonas haemaphysalidis]
MTYPSLRAVLCASVLFPLSVAPVLAQDALRVGLAANITSLDPQFHVVGSNSALARNVFDGLVNQDDRQQLVAGLASVWKPVDDTTWEFKLRSGVRFHDGSPMEAEDIAASLRRVPTVRNSPSSFLPYVRPISAVEVVDAQTIRIRTTEPYPLLPNALSRIAILPRSLERAETADFNSGKAMIGTGPFRFASYTPGDRLELEAAVPGEGAWRRVTFRFIPTNASRVAALLSNDVDVIEGVPTTDIAKLRSDGKITLSSVASNRVMYLHLDHEREQSPFVRGRNGEAIPNALRDPRVRQALSLALDRRAIVARVMDGEGTPAGQLVPEGYFGFVPGLAAPAFDAAGARRLLAEAGLPNGFQMTLHATNDRYPNDDKVAQVLAQLWTRVGIQTKVEAQPGNIFFARASNREYSVIMGGAAAETGEASSVLRPLLATFNPEKGDGSGNRGRYSNPEFDRLLAEALRTVDDRKREALLRQATELAIKDNGVIPIFFLANSWASRPGFNYRPRTDGWTLAINATR